MESLLLWFAKVDEADDYFWRGDTYKENVPQDFGIGRTQV